MAEAAKLTIVTADEILPKEWLKQAEVSQTTIPKHFVSKIVHIPYPCHPLASHTQYRVDEIHIKKYLKLSKTQKGFQEYLDNMILEPKIKNNYAYLRASGGKDYLDKLKI